MTARTRRRREKKAGERNAAAGVEDGVKEEVRGAMTPGRAKKTGFMVGTAVWLVLLGVVERRRRVRRLEEKLEIVVQEVAANP